MLLAVCVIALLMAGGIFRSDAYAATTYKVRFGSMKDGTFVHNLAGYDRSVKASAVITLPTRKMQNSICYWVDQKTRKVYSCNAKFTVRYVAKKYAQFYDPETKKELTALRKTYGISRYARMQAFPTTNPKYKRFLGWSQDPNAKYPSYKAGDTVRMYKTTKYYAVFGTASTDTKQIVLYDNKGNEYKRMDVSSGLTFPSVNLLDGSTVIGWSTSKGKKSAPEYLEDETIPAREGAYYMVVRKPADDATRGVAGLRKPATHSRLYIIGDSRTAFMKSEFGANPAKTTLIGNAGAGYAWLEGTDPLRSTCAYERLIAYLDKYRNTSAGKNPAVVFNLGVNDLGNISKYITFYKKVAPVLKKVYHCDLYIMAVNPMNRETLRYAMISFFDKAEDYQTVQTVKKIEEFNTRIKSGLDGVYEYIDTYSYLLQYGWSSWCNSDYRGYWEPDGLHYSETTYEKIYNYTVMMTDRS